MSFDYRTRENNTEASSELVALTKQYSIAQSAYYTPSTITTTNSEDTYSQNYAATTKVITDIVHTNYRKKIAQGQIINSPCWINHTYENNSPIVVNYQAQDFRWMYNAANQLVPAVYIERNAFGPIPLDEVLEGRDNYLPLPQGAPDRQKHCDLAVTSAYAAINDSDILVGAAIAESGKTTRDMIKLARKAYKILRAIKHPRSPKRITRKSIKQARNEAEELYMSARYNLRPVYYDMMGTMDLLDRDTTVQRFTHRGGSSDSVSDSSVVEFLSTLFPGVTLRVEKRSSNVVDARAGVMVNVKDDTKWRHAGISMITETAWELTPFSFIADWFANTGSVLSSWAPSPGVQILTSWCSINEYAEQEIVLSPVSYRNDSYPRAVKSRPAAYVVTAIGLWGSKSKISKSYERVVNPRRPYLPTIDVNMDFLKSLDLAIIGKKLASIR